MFVIFLVMTISFWSAGGAGQTNDQKRQQKCKNECVERQHEAICLEKDPKRRAAYQKCRRGPADKIVYARCEKECRKA
jgi:hypothetical protein